MDVDTLQRYYRHMSYRWVGPYYYDYPDGEDLGGKLAFCGQLGFLLSGPVAVINAYMRYPFPTTQAGRFLRMFRAIGPGVGMGLAFATTTYYATIIREKDDYFNHVLGGFAAGTIFGAVNGLKYGIYMSVICGFLAGAIKGSSKYSEARNNAVNRSFSPYIRRMKDLAKYPEKGDNWVKAYPPEN